MNGTSKRSLNAMLVNFKMIMVKIRACYTYRYHYRVRQIYIVWMVMDCLTKRIGSEPNLPIKRSISTGTMLNFDGDRHGDGTRKQALRCGLNDPQQITAANISYYFHLLCYFKTFLFFFVTDCIGRNWWLRGRRPHWRYRSWRCGSPWLYRVTGGVSGHQGSGDPREPLRPRNSFTFGFL